MKTIVLSVFWGLFCLTLCVAQKVEVKEDRNYDLAGKKTFRIQSGDLVMVMKGEVDQEALKKQIRAALKREFESKGFQEADSADVRISFVAEVLEREELENVGPLGQAPARTGAEIDQRQVWSQEVRTGSLAIEVMDGSTRKSVWRSMCAINFRSTEMGDVMQAAVVRSMRKFPKRKK